MTREQIVEFCKRAPAVGAVRHEEFADYVVPLTQRKKIDDEWTTVESPYMAVDGKLAMANEDHRRQGKRIDFSAPQVLVDSGDQLTLLITVTSELYGSRHGIATSRRVGGTDIERAFPWEVAETSAIGRALGAMGYGLFPGSGLASAEDMIRATSDEAEAPRAPAVERRPAPGNGHGQAPQPQPPRGPREQGEPVQPSAGRPRSAISAVQRRKLNELYRGVNGGSEAEAMRGLDALFVEQFKHGMNDASYEEGAHITAQLLAAQRAR